MACAHENFQADVQVGRITGEEGSNDPVTFIAELKVRCVDCEESFGFRGMPPGLSWSGPARTPDALEAHLPLLSPTELAMQGPLPGLSEDPPPHSGASYRIRVQ